MSMFNFQRIVYLIFHRVILRLFLFFFSFPPVIREENAFLLSFEAGVYDSPLLLFLFFFLGMRVFLRWMMMFGFEFAVFKVFAFGD